MGINYSKIQKTVDKVLQPPLGQKVTLTNKVTGAYDPVAQTFSETITNQTGTAAIFDRGNKEINGTTILMGDKKMLLSAVGITKPKINDTVMVGGINYTIKEPLAEINPAGTVVLYKLNLRV